MGIIAIFQLIGLLFSIVINLPDFIKAIKLLRELMKDADKRTVAEMGEELRVAYAAYQKDKDQAKLVNAVKATASKLETCINARKCNKR